MTSVPFGCDRDPFVVACDPRVSGVEHEANAEVSESVREAVGDVMVHHRNQVGSTVDQRYLGADRAEERRVLRADRAAPHDDEVTDRLVEIQDRRRVDDVGIAEVDVGWVKRARTRRDDDRVGLQDTRLAAREPNVHGAVGPESSVALYELDAVRSDVRTDLAGDRLDHTARTACSRLTANAGSRWRLRPSYTSRFRNPVRYSAASRRLFDGTHALIAAAPPGRVSRSTIATRLPKYAACAAPFSRRTRADDDEVEGLIHGAQCVRARASRRDLERAWLLSPWARPPESGDGPGY